MPKYFQTVDHRVFLTNIKNTYKASIKHYTDIGSPCRAPLSNLKYFVIFLLLMMQDS